MDIFSRGVARSRISRGDPLEAHARVGKDPAGEALAFANQPEKHVFGLDAEAPQLTRLVAREEQYPARPLREPFEHAAEHTADSPGGYIPIVRRVHAANSGAVSSTSSPNARKPPSRGS